MLAEAHGCHTESADLLWRCYQRSFGDVDMVSESIDNDWRTGLWLGGNLRYLSRLKSEIQRRVLFKKSQSNTSAILVTWNDLRSQCNSGTSSNQTNKTQDCKLFSTKVVRKNVAGFWFRGIFHSFWMYCYAFLGFYNRKQERIRLGGLNEDNPLLI